MKKILEQMPLMIIGTISFAVVSIMDFILLFMALCVKAVRCVFMKLVLILDPDGWDRDERKDILEFALSCVNDGYKYYIDLMYPVEEDFEDDDEDESYYDDDED